MTRYEYSDLLRYLSKTKEQLAREVGRKLVSLIPIIS